MTSASLSIQQIADIWYSKWKNPDGAGNKIWHNLLNWQIMTELNNTTLQHTLLSQASSLMSCALLIIIYHLYGMLFSPGKPDIG
ncbi:hypothetical protein ACJX0J_030746, partial [Zea mays]